MNLQQVLLFFSHGPSLPWYGAKIPC
jgi:hypothetical protein